MTTGAPERREGERLPFTHTRPIFWQDTDAARIVYTGRFVDYMLEAAEAFMRAYLGQDWFIQTVDQGSGGPVVHLDIDFVSPLTPRDMLEVEVYVERVGRTSVTYAVRGYGSGRRLSFTGRFVSVRVSYERRRSIPLDDDVRAILEDYRARCPAPE